MRAVDERQSLQTLGREEKTNARTLATLQEACEGREETKQRLESEITTLEEKKGELEERVGSLQSDLSKAKKELNSQQAEYAKITYAICLTVSGSKISNDEIAGSWKPS